MRHLAVRLEGNQQFPTSGTRFRAEQRRLLDDEDGPMLKVLKGFHGSAIVVPHASRLRPDRERLEKRFERFLVRTER
jgi:hypothetical protein